MYGILSSKRFYGYLNSHIFARNENIQNHPENSLIVDLQ
jgi:hypothetical protein